MVFNGHHAVDGPAMTCSRVSLINFLLDKKAIIVIKIEQPIAMSGRLLNEGRELKR